MCKMHYFRTMVNIGFKMWQNPGRKNTPWKAKYIPNIYIYTSTENARLQWRSLGHAVPRQNMYPCFCGKKHFKTRNILFWSLGKHYSSVSMWLCCNTTSHRSEPLLNNLQYCNPNSSTKATLLRREGNPPDLLNRLLACSIKWLSLICHQCSLCWTSKSPSNNLMLICCL